MTPSLETEYAVLSSELRQTAVTGSLLQQVQLFELRQVPGIAETDVACRWDHSKAAANTSKHVQSHCHFTSICPSCDQIECLQTQSINAQAAAGDTKAYKWHRNGG